MIFHLLTELTVVAHFLFLLFVVGGVVLVRRHRWLAVPHLLAVVWAVYVEAAPGIICPLTPLENRFATLAGAAGYTGGFVEHYLVPIIYPDGLTRGVQWMLAAFVFAVNAVGYSLVLRGAAAARLTASASAASTPSSPATR